ALGELVVARQPPDGAVPSSTHQVIRWSDASTFPAWARAVEALTLSPTRGVAELIRGVLWAAAASSVAALAGCVRRYSALLEHAADAQATGRALTREQLRAFTGPMGGQLAMWELITPSGGSTDLDLDDRERLPALRALIDQELASADAKLDRLRAVLADGTPTIVFTGSVDTVRYLRTRLAGVAWCTGAAAGIGHLHADREVILAAFAPGGVGPDVLITTDIAAEGLDLHRAARVVHFDLPWTPMRLRQREGRVARLGAGRSSVDVVWFRPPEWLDRKERRALRVRLKARAVVRAGFHHRAPELWRWRHELAATAGSPTPFGQCAAVRGARRAGLLIAFELQGGSERLGSLLGVVNEAGEWVDDPGVITDAITRAATGEEVDVVPGTWDAWLERALPHARAAVRRANDCHWSWSELRPEVRTFVRRLRREAADAARRRDARELALLERGLAFATHGHTAGELTLVLEMAEAPRPGLLQALSKLREQRRERRPITLRVAGMVLFVP
ncbi:MAG TPA: C-terminal helicase domain-containing protein, partial [Gemmatimonadales bacterium]|nr:C-terminal helicase domain-containing protein [Gemmatimonadales bacterium]